MLSRRCFLKFAVALVSAAVVYGRAEAAAMPTECAETTINAMNADIQSMQDGASKTTATMEMQMAEDMMASNNIGACEAHMRHALELWKNDAPGRRP